MSQVLLNATWWAGGKVSARFGDPAGRVVTVTLTVYAALIALVLGCLVVGIVLRSTMSYLAAAFSRGFPVSSPSVIVLPPKSPGRPPPGISDELANDAFDESDTGAAASSNASTHVVGRRACQDLSVWLSGTQAAALFPTPCSGKRVKPATLMYDDWFIQSGERVRGANFPLAAELCTQHRLDYAERKTKTKCATFGCWSKGVPNPTKGVLECSLRASERLIPGARITESPRIGETNRCPIRHPATKSVKIKGVESESPWSDDSLHSSEHDMSIQKRVSTGSERAPAGSDMSRHTAPLPETSTAWSDSAPFTGVRQKAYHFDDAFVPATGRHG